MLDLNDINFSKISLFEVIVKIMSNIRNDFSKKCVIKMCEKKIKESLFINSDQFSEDKKIKKLLILFYKTWNFGGPIHVYKLSDMLWLDNVFLYKKGNSFSLGVLFMYIANQLNLSIVPILFPTQLILKFQNSKGRYFYINPLNGDILNQHILKSWLKGNISPSIKLNDHHLQDALSLDLLKKILDILKIALIEERNIELALNVSNILLTLKPKDPYEIRDRGLIFSQLNCYHVAISDLLYFIEQCPDDPISDIIKMQIHSIEQKKMIFH